ALLVEHSGQLPVKPVADSGQAEDCGRDQVGFGGLRDEDQPQENRNAGQASGAECVRPGNDSVTHAPLLIEPDQELGRVGLSAQEGRSSRSPSCTTACATWPTGWPSAKARARSRARASPVLQWQRADSMPVAWCTTAWSSVRPNRCSAESPLL